MAGANFPQCVGPSYHLNDKKAAVQSAINCYIQLLDDGKKMMASIPGETVVMTLPAGVRGSKNVQGRWFVVSGNTLYELTLPATFTVRGTLVTNSGYVGMDDNTFQIAIVDGDNLYIFNLTTNLLTQVTVSGWRGSNDVYELDGYFIFVDPGTDQFYLSKIDNGTLLDSLDFSSADSSPDNILTHRVNHRQAVFFGSDSTEIWIDSGNASFPFTRYNSYTIDVGVVGQKAVINAADTLFWIGDTFRGTGIVYMMAGNQPTRVSTQAIEQALKTSTDLSQATMWCYQIEGHEFIGINAPGMATTLVYDAAIQQWHERGEWVNGDWAPLNSRLNTFYKDNQYACNDNGDIVRLDANVNTLAGRVLVRERTWPHIVQESMEPISFYGLELSMKTGFGGNVTLQISNDTGENFGPMLLRSLGVTGRWMRPVRWLGLGSAINRVFRIRCSDNVPFAIYSAAVQT